MLYKKVCIEAFGYELPETIVTSLSLEERLAAVYEKVNPDGHEKVLLDDIRALQAKAA